MTPDNSRDDIRKLIGGYATGSLTEAERKRLLDAALEDQELFEELAGEHALKELLEQPGARQRLLGALERTPAVGWWSRPWPWAAAAVTIALAIGVVIFNRSAAPPQEVAQVLKSAEPVAAPPPPPPPPAPGPAAPRALRKVAPPAPAAIAPAAPKVSVDAVEEARADKAAAQPEVLPQVQALAAPPAPQAKQPAVGAVSGFAARGGRAEALAANIVSVFGFNYTVRADGVLEIVPSSPGFLSVAAGANVLLPSAAVAAGTPVRVQIPAEAASLSIGFYAVQGINASPVRRDETSGTVTDQDPPNGRISIQLFLTPKTQ